MTCDKPEKEAAERERGERGLLLFLIIFVSVIIYLSRIAITDSNALE
jgi:hypothetical protein